MFQDIFPRSLDLQYVNKPPERGDWLLVLRKGKVGLVSGPEGKRFPEIGEFSDMETADTLHLFSVDGKGVHLHLGGEDFPGFEFSDIMAFRGFSPSWVGFVGATASHLGLWYLSNRYCGSCGRRMRPKEEERALVCGDCGNVVFPRISPAVIVGVIDGDRLLLTRYANSRDNRLTALIAGFMEIGETFEDTIRREVCEEVGLRVDNIRYYRSQPWPFSGSVLAGFYADLSGSSELTVDRCELGEAKWLTRDELPTDLSSISLTAEMIDMFRRKRHPGG